MFPRLVCCALSSLHLIALSGASNGAAKPVLNAFVASYDQRKGSRFVLTCNAVLGESPIGFQWSHDGRPIDDLSRYQIDNLDLMSILLIKNIAPENSGNYSCFASNEHGFDRQTTRLNVQGHLVFHFESRYSFWINNFHQLSFSLSLSPIFH